MFALFFRGMILYAAMILTMRALGRRQMGQYQPYEFAMTIMLADVISAPMESASTPLLYGLVPVGAMFAVYGLITLGSMRSDKIRAFVSGRPTVVVNRGVIDRRELNRLCLSAADLLEGLRGCGILDPAQVGTAVVEANGSLSAFPAPEHRPPSAEEMGIAPEEEGLPMILIMDGRVQPRNLEKTGRDEIWLRRALGKTEISQVYLASLDAAGRMLLQLKDGAVRRFPADGGARR